MTSMITEAALFLSRWTALSVLSKATILLALGLTVAWLAGRSRASVRHLVFAATFAALAALPLVLVTVPGVAIEISTSHAAAPPASIAPAPFATGVPLSSVGGVSIQSTALALSWPAIIRFVWTAGGLLLLAPLAFNLWSLRRLRRNGLPWPESRQRMESLAAARGVRHPVEVLLHEALRRARVAGSGASLRPGPRAGACAARRLCHAVNVSRDLRLLLVPSHGLDGMAAAVPRSRARL